MNKTLLKERWQDYLFVLIFIMSLFFKIRLVDQYPIFGDEGFSVAAASAIFKTGVPKLYGGLYTRDILHHYPMALLVGIFGDGKLAVRSLSIIFFQLTLILVYKFCIRNFNASTAFATVVFLVGSRYFNYFTTNARMYSGGMFFCFAAVYAYSRGYFEDIELYKFLTVIACICAMSTVIVALPVILGLAIFHLAYDFKSAVKDKYVYGLLIFTLMFYFYRWEIFSAPIMDFSKVDVSVHWVTRSAVDKGLSLTSLLSFWRGMLNRIFPYSFFILPFSAYLYFFKERKKQYLLLWTVFLVPFLFISFFQNRDYKYFFPEMIFFLVLTIHFLVYLATSVINFIRTTISTGNSSRTIKVISGGCFLLLAGAGVVKLIGVDQVADRLTYPLVFTEEFLENSEPALNYLSRHIGPEDIVISTEIGLTYFYKIPFQYFLSQRYFLSKGEWGDWGAEREPYFGSLMLDDINKFEEVLRTHRHHNIWILANKKYSWSIGEAMREWVGGKFETVFDENYAKSNTKVLYRPSQGKGSL